MKNNLHTVQKDLLKILTENGDEPLTIRELQGELGVSSTSVVAHHLLQLEKKGYLKRNPFNPRDYQILKDGPEKQVSYLNLYGLAHCGPSGSVLDGNPIERIPVSTRMLTFAADDAFMVKAKGNSMEPKIHSGDLVIVRRVQDADNGSIVVCRNDGEVLIKKIRKEEEGKIILISLNPEYPPFLAAEDFEIAGEVKSVITHKVF